MDLHNPLTESKTNVPVIVPPPNFIGKNTDLMSESSGSEVGSKIYNYTNVSNASFKIFNSHKHVPFRSCYTSLSKFEHDNLYHCLSINDISTIPSCSPMQTRTSSFRTQKCDTSVKRPKNAHIFNRLNNYKRIPFISLFNTQDTESIRTSVQFPKHRIQKMKISNDDDGFELTENGVNLSKRLLSRNMNNPIHQKKRKHNTGKSKVKCSFNKPTPAYILGNENRCVVINTKNTTKEQLLLNNVEYSIYGIENDRQIDKIRISNKKYDICRVHHSKDALFSIMSLILIDLPNILEPYHIINPSLRIVIVRAMTHMLDNKKIWLLKAFEKILNITSTKDMRSYIRELRKRTTSTTKLETLVFSYIYNCELFISSTDKNNVYSCLSTSEIFNTLHIQTDRVIDHTVHIGVGLQKTRNGRLTKRYLYFREQKIPIRLDGVSQKHRVQIMNHILKISTGTALLYYKKICLEERASYLKKSESSMRNLQKAAKLVQIQREDELKQANGPEQKLDQQILDNFLGHKHKTDPAHRCGVKSSKRVKLSLPIELCVIVQKTADGLERLLINKSDIGLFDVVHHANIDSFTIKGKKYKIFDTPSDHGCCFHSLSLVLAHWKNLEPSMYVHGKQLRKDIATCISKLLKKENSWIHEAFNILTDCKDLSSKKDTLAKRKAYVKFLHNPKTWGTRFEIFIFCYLYQCELSIATTMESNQFKFEQSGALFDLVPSVPKVQVLRKGYIGNVHAHDIARKDQNPKNHYIYLQSVGDTIELNKVKQNVRIRKLKYLSTSTLPKAKLLFTKCIDVLKKVNVQTHATNLSSYNNTRHGQQNKRKHDAIINQCPGELDLDDYKNIKKMWINLDAKSPLHEQLPVVKAMKCFSDDVANLQLELAKPCLRCHRSWFAEEIISDAVICKACTEDKGSFCDNCAPHKFDKKFVPCEVCQANDVIGNPNLFSVFNNMQPGPPVKVIQDLNQEEIMLISHCMPMVHVYRKTGNRYGYKDHIICIPQNIGPLVNKLPHHISKIKIMWMVREGKNDTFRKIRISREKIRLALVWLIEHNKLYENVHIDEDNLASLPEGEINNKDIPKTIIPHDAFMDFDNEEKSDQIGEDYDMEDTEMQQTSIEHIDSQNTDDCNMGYDSDSELRYFSDDGNMGYDSDSELRYFSDGKDEKQDTLNENWSDVDIEMVDTTSNTFDIDNILPKRQRLTQSKTSNIASVFFTRNKFVSKPFVSVFSPMMSNTLVRNTNTSKRKYSSISTNTVNNKHDNKQIQDGKKITLRKAAFFNAFPNTNISCDNFPSSMDMASDDEFGDTPDTDDVPFTPVFSMRDQKQMREDSLRTPASCIGGNTANPFQQTQSMSYLPVNEETQEKEINILRAILDPKDKETIGLGTHKLPLAWPEKSKYGADEFNTPGLAAACFPDLFPYGKGDFTQRGRKRNVSIYVARRFYEQYADFENGQLTYRFAKHKFWSFWIFNRSNRHALLGHTNAFIESTPSTKTMSREAMLAEVDKGTANILTMGLGRYEANLVGTDGYWHQQCQELQAAIRDAGYPTAFYTFTYADAHCPELYRLLPFPKHLSLKEIANLPYVEREKILSENQHIAAWFFYKRFQAFSKHMRNCLDTEWYWQRIESQFRTAFHTHGCLKMRNDNHLMSNCHKALLGFLANEKIEHLSSLRKNDLPEQDLFPIDKLQEATKNSQPQYVELLNAFVLGKSKLKKKGTCFYVGVAFDQKNENSDAVRSGAQEKKTCIQQGMINPKVLCKINGLSPCIAYAIEHHLLGFMKENAEHLTLNKSALFGLGNRPKGWRNMECTVTLLSGNYRSSRYRAYPELDVIFDTIDASDKKAIKNELHKLRLAGKIAEKEIVKFVDYIVCTYNPQMDASSDLRPLARAKEIPHPCTYEFNTFDAKSINCLSRDDPRFKQWLQDNEVNHGSLVNQVQTPHNHEKGGCLRTKKKTEELSCKYHFPFQLRPTSSVTFEPHGKNSNGDIIYRTKIDTKRNDSLLNCYCRFMLDSWRANMDLQIIMDPVACAQYIAKYTTKSEISSKEKVKFIRDIIKSSPEADSNERILRRCAMRSEGNRDLGAQEIKFLNMHLPLVESSFDFKSISLQGRRSIKDITDLDDVDPNIDVKSASYSSLRDIYSDRLSYKFTDVCKKQLQSIDSLEDMSFNNFGKMFLATKGKLSLRKEVKDKITIYRFWPFCQETSKHLLYQKYCKYFLIQYKPWTNDPLQLCRKYLPKLKKGVNYTKDQFTLPAYVKAHTEWLDSDDMHKAAAINNITRELEEAQNAHRIWQQSVDDIYEDTERDDPEFAQPQWMEIAQFAKVYESLDENNAPARESEWHTPRFPISKELKYDGVRFIDDESKNDIIHDTTAVDVSKLAHEQKIAFEEIKNHFDSKDTDALHMVLHGTAGTGKSYILKALKHMIKDAFHITATTGLAASLVNGCTVHRKMRLPIQEYQKKELKNANLVGLQEHFAKFKSNPAQCYIVIDEMSQLSCESIYWIHKRAQQAFSNNFLDFGGMSIILVGDFGQLPPVRSKALYNKEVYSKRDIDGLALYERNFKTVVFLRYNYRANALQNAKTPAEKREAQENAVYANLLERMRDGITTNEDFRLLATRFLSCNPKTQEFENAMHLYYGREEANARNMKKLFTLDEPICTISGIHDPPSAKNIDSKHFANLLGEFKFAITAKVMLIQNVWQNANLVNGSIGTIYDIIYEKGVAPPSQPLFILVDFPNYSGKPFIAAHPKLVPIVPVSFSFVTTDNKTVTRKQMPLMLAYGLTIHKAQGSQFDKCVVEIGDSDPSIHPGLAFVALSRCRKLKHYLIKDVNHDRFTRIPKFKLYKYRWYEEKVLEENFQKLRKKHGFVPHTKNVHDLNTLDTSTSSHFNYIPKRRKRK